MRIRNLFITRFAAALLGFTAGILPAYAGIAGGGYAGHRVIAGDFNGDGWADLLLQPLSNAKDTALLLSSPTGAFGKPAIWGDPHAGERWNADVHRLYVGDFNGDGRATSSCRQRRGLRALSCSRAPTEISPARRKVLLPR